MFWRSPGVTICPIHIALPHFGGEGGGGRKSDVIWWFRLVKNRATSVLLSSVPKINQPSTKVVVIANAKSEGGLYSAVCSLSAIDLSTSNINVLCLRFSTSTVPDLIIKTVWSILPYSCIYVNANVS